MILSFSVNSFYNVEATTKGREIELPITVASGLNKPIVCVIIADEFCYSELRTPAGNDRVLAKFGHCRFLKN